MKTSEFLPKLILGLILSLIVACAGLGLLALSGWLICSAAIAGFHPSSAIYFNYLIPAAGIRFFALTRIVSRYAERIVSHGVTLRILSQLRIWFYQCIEPLDPAYLMRYQNSDLLNRSISDIEVLNELYLKLITPLTVSILVSIVLSLLLFSILPLAGWVAAITLFLTIVCIMFFSFFIGKKLAQRIQTCIREYRMAVIEFLSHMKEVFIYLSPKKALHQLLLFQNNLHNAQYKIAHIRGMLQALITIILGGLMSGVMYLCITDMTKGNIKTPILCLLILALLAAFEVFSSLPSALDALGKAWVSRERLKEITDEKPSLVFPISQPHRSTSFDIICDKLSFSHSNGLPIFQSFNLKIPSCGALIISGISGIGKTTLLELIARIYDPIDGEIRIDNTPLHQFTEFDLRNQVTLISQKDYFFNTSLRENLKIANTAATDAQIWNALERVGLRQLIETRKDALNTITGEFGERFSTGQLRRLSIARALLRSTPIMLFDEPTEGLDEASAKKIWSVLLDDLCDKTRIIVSHRPPRAQTVQYLKLTEDNVNGKSME